MDKYNTLWRRFGATLIDSVVLWPLGLLSGYAQESPHKLTFIAGTLFSTALYFTYFIVLHGKYGQTPGKKIANIKVVDLGENELIGIKKSAIRELPLMIADAGILIYLSVILFSGSDPVIVRDRYTDLVFWTCLLWLVIEFVTMLTNYRKRAANDLLAGSVVINITPYIRSRFTRLQ